MFDEAAAFLGSVLNMCKYGNIWERSRFHMGSRLSAACRGPGGLLPHQLADSEAKSSSLEMEFGKFGKSWRRTQRSERDIS